MVKAGKKIAIGGSITEITQARPRYTPFHTKPVTHQGIPSVLNSAAPWASTQNRMLAIHSEA